MGAYTLADIPCDNNGKINDCALSCYRNVKLTFSSIQSVNILTLQQLENNSVEKCKCNTFTYFKQSNSKKYVYKEKNGFYTNYIIQAENGQWNFKETYPLDSKKLVTCNGVLVPSTTSFEKRQEQAVDPNSTITAVDTVIPPSSAAPDPQITTKDPLVVPPTTIDPPIVPPTTKDTPQTAESSISTSLTAPKKPNPTASALTPMPTNEPGFDFVREKSLGYTKGPSITVIVGSAVGSIAFLALITILFMFWKKKQSKKNALSSQTVYSMPSSSGMPSAKEVSAPVKEVSAPQSYGLQIPINPPEEELTAEVTNKTVVWKAITDYYPQQEDEMEIIEGDGVVLGLIFSDGWGQGKNLRTNEDGLVALNCLRKTSQRVDLPNKI